MDNNTKSPLIYKDEILLAKIKELQRKQDAILKLKTNKQNVEKLYWEEIEKLNRKISILQDEILEKELLQEYIQKPNEQLDQRIKKDQKTIYLLKTNKKELGKSYLEENEVLKRKIEEMRCEIDEKQKQIDHIKKNEKQIFIKLVETKYLLKNLLDKSVIMKAFSNEEWITFEDQFNCLYPDFILELKKKCPKMKVNDIRYCCLFRLGIKTSKIAIVFDLENNTVSKYQKTILEKYFKSYKDKSLKYILSNEI